MSIQHDHTLNPVTALEFYNDSGRLLILAGEGCFLKVIEAETSRLICQCKIFEAQAIHGLALSENAESGNDIDLQLVIWGGSCLTLLNRQTFQSILSRAVCSVTELEVSTPDWILDVALSPSGHGCVLLTAHNTILRATITRDCKSVSFESLPSPSRSILYSAHLIYESPTLILVAAGTVFGEIIVWQCALSKTDSAPTSKTLCTLVGHEGSIFGVNISPEVTDRSGTKTRLLASCSDDRTIRVWDIFDLAKVCAEDDNSTSTAAPLPRETGFGENDQSGSSRSTSAYLAMAMGHASRIWGVRFYQPESLMNDSSINLLSFGEDATTQRWSLSSWNAFQISSAQAGVCTNLPKASLLHGETFAYHRGKHIFSAAISRPDGPQLHLASGGADGRIPIYQISTPREGDEHAESNGGKTAHRSVSVDERGMTSQRFADFKSGVAVAECQKPDDRTSMSSVWDLDIVEVPSVAESASPKANDQLAAETVPGLESDVTIAHNRSDTGDVSTVATERIVRKTSKKPKVKKISKDAWNRYAFLAKDKLLVTTTFGRILLCDLDFSAKWQQITTREEEQLALRSYTVMKGVPELGIAFIAGTSGAVYIYHSTLQDHRAVNDHSTDMAASELMVFGKVNGKVADMFPIVEQDKSVSLLVTTLGGTTAIRFSISVQNFWDLRAVQTTSLKLPKKFAVTSAAEVGGLTILGGRNGSLAVYKAYDSQYLTSVGTGGESDAITSVIPLLASETNFLTTSRDGSFSIFTISRQKDQSLAPCSLSIACVHQGTPPFGPMIEAAWFEGGDLFLYGFRSKSFVVWNETKQCEVAAIDCGGAHRSYAYSPLGGSEGGGHFAYTKASKLYIHSTKKASHKVLKQGGHGREIKACAVPPDQSLFATGAEDTVIRIWKYNDQNGPLRHEFDSLNIMKKHTTGIQKLLWYESSYLFSSGGNEEFFVWAVTSIEGFGVGAVCEAQCPDRTEDGDLRITSFDVTELPSSFQNRVQQQLLISLAYSDSTIRSYRYSKELGFEILATGRYTSSCLTQLQHLRVSEDEVCLVTAATDGNLAIWSFGIAKDLSTSTATTLQLQSVHKIHQNSIKSFDVLDRGENGTIVIATGGDDNALGLTIYSQQALTTGAAPTKTIFRSAHAAAVTGLAFVPGRDLRIVTSSNDQRVREWSISLDVAGHQVEDIRKVGDVFTSIADVGDMAILRGGGDSADGKKIVVVGNGMDVWRVGQESLI
ncbi:hypothetical protein BP5796_03181 [Coleophoma crateriformis]|uniref:WD40 repeat-like protein n=1 Tax=Coleophoma crateriformis TaxID=565419 RepID=A0A3D8SME3_9HELO|nr:hypothetical protein BP5796_03181 [Coleophoma crateriformis]